MVVRFIFRKDARHPDRAGKITCRLTVDGVSAPPFTTPVKCGYAQWDAAAQRLRVPAMPRRKEQEPDDAFARRLREAQAERAQVERDNKRLAALLQQLDALEYELVSRHGQLLTAALVAQAYKAAGAPALSLLALFDLFVAERATLVGIEISAATLGVDRTRRRLTERFLRTHKVLALRPEAFELAYCDKFIHWLRVAEGNGHDYAQKCLATVQQVLLWGVRRRLLAENPMRHYQFRKAATKELVFLSSDELGRVAYYPFALPALQRAAACFVFQCWTGLAYADLVSLRLPRDATTDEQGRRWLRVTRQKSQLEKPLDCLVPLLPEAERLLSAYQQQLPVISNQKYNRHLKEVAAICGLSVERLTTHVGRKTAGVLLLNAGVRMEIVSRILGHTDIRTTQRLYARILDTTIQLDIRRVFGAHQAPVLAPASAAADAPRYHSFEQRRGLPVAEPLAYTPQMPNAGRLPLEILQQA